MKQTLLDKFMSRKGLYVGFWFMAIFMVTILIYLTAYMHKEVPPIPKEVKSVDGTVLYTHDDIVQGKAFFQEFGLMDWGSYLGMGAYLGPDLTAEQLHNRVKFLYNYYAKQKFGKACKDLTPEEKGQIKEIVKKDVRSTKLEKDQVVYSEASAQAYKANVDYWVNVLVNGDKERGYPGGFMSKEQAEKIAAFIDWGQLVASTLRPNTNRTWSNNWPNEPMIDQNILWSNHATSLWEFLLLWALTIIVIYLFYEYLLNRKEELEPTLQITSLYKSQKKLLKYVPIVALLFVLQLFMGGYITHLTTDPAHDFIIPQSLLPYNAARPIHTQLAILWVAVGWLVGGLLVAPWVAGKDHKMPWLVDVLWFALVFVGVGSLIGIWLGTTGKLPDSWFWLGNEGRELINLGRLWDILLVGGLVFWFLLVYTLIRKASKTNSLVSTIIWAAFAIATLYIAGMMPLTHIQPNFTIDDYFRWWVIHLWVELTFELFAAGVLAYMTVSLGLISYKTAERVMFFELFLVMLSGTLGVGHHYWFQGLDEYWIAIGGIFSSLEPLPLVLMMVEAMKNQREKVHSGENFPFKVTFMWLAGSAFLNWIGAGFLGMLINTPTIDYYGHGTYIIMPHGHVALLGAFGYISLAFIYMTARTNSLANGLKWNEKLSKWGFWLLTLGVLIYAIPYAVVGFHQAAVAFNKGYYFARLHETIAELSGWLWFRLIPDTMMIIGGLIIFIDLVIKIYFSKKAQAVA